jgi:hypothetical protein
LNKKNILIRIYNGFIKILKKFTYQIKLLILFKKILNYKNKNVKLKKFINAKKLVILLNVDIMLRIKDLIRKIKINNMK